VVHSLDPHSINFSNDRVSGGKELCFLIILSLLEGDDNLLTLPIWSTSSRGYPKGGHRWQCNWAIATSGYIILHIFHQCQCSLALTLFYNIIQQWFCLFSRRLWLFSSNKREVMMWVFCKKKQSNVSFCFMWNNCCTISFVHYNLCVASLRSRWK